MKLKKDYFGFAFGILIGIFLTSICIFFVLDKLKVFDSVKTDVSQTNYKNIESETEKQHKIENIPSKESNTSKKEDNNSDLKKENNNNVIKKKTQNDVAIYFNELNNTVFSKENIKKYSDKAKQNFIKITDFIFYDTEIYGYTFDELSDNFKLKIMSIMIGIDSRMEQYFPNYKDIIKNKYNNIKEIIISEYLETSNRVCQEIGPEACNEAKKGLETLKDSFNLTFDILKAFGKTELQNLRDWYEIFRDKNKIN